jgi:hypothetical protein
VGVGGHRHAAVALPPRKTRHPLWLGWVGPKVVLDGCGKSRPHRPVASRCTNWAIPVYTTVETELLLSLMATNTQYCMRFALLLRQLILQHCVSCYLITWWLASPAILIPPVRWKPSFIRRHTVFNPVQILCYLLRGHLTLKCQLKTTLQIAVCNSSMA